VSKSYILKEAVAKYTVKLIVKTKAYLAIARRGLGMCT
jgi:hypothetical protein